MLKPVYIDAAEPALLIVDGPSLLMRTASRQQFRFPLREIDRLHISGNVRVDSAALQACVNASIPVCFHGPNESLGYLLASQPQSSRLSSLLQSFLQIPNASSRYADWCRAVERREIISALKRLGVRALDLRPASAESAMLAVLPAASVTGKTLRKLAEGVFALRVAAELASHRVDPLLVAGSASRYQLISDCARILSWSFYADWHAWLDGGNCDHANIRRSAVECIELHGSRDAQRVHSLLDAFIAWLGLCL
jgi:hypothetical protein